jgi:hypothetical protein
MSLELALVIEHLDVLEQRHLCGAATLKAIGELAALTVEKNASVTALS